MKRLFGLIGLTYLFVLAVVFYCQSIALVWTIIVASIVATVAMLFLKLIKKHAKLFNCVIAVSLSAFCAVVSLILYWNINYCPVIDEYSNKELSICGYICEEVQKTESNFSCVLLADEINGEKASVKIHLSSYSDLGLEDFDRVEAIITPEKCTDNYKLSKKIFLSAYDESFEIAKTGEKQFSLYRYAVQARKALKASLDSLLADSSSSLCKAILLGDKAALPADVKESFSKTGTSFMIVVSGMHLAIVTGFILFLFRKTVKNKVLLCIIALLAIIVYSAVTGFSSSVIRSAIMVAMTYIGAVFFRQAESVNSLGIAALALTLFNPFSVGDVGMLLSFSATLGIVLWSRPLAEYTIRRFKVKRKFFKRIIESACVSLSASLWIMPITILAFGTISPLTVIISVICEPLISALLVCSLAASVLYVCPLISFFAYPFALASGVISKLTIEILTFFADFPFCSVKADKPYFYIWLILTVILVVVGYIIKAKKFYIESASAFSFAALMLGWAIFAIIESNTAVLYLYNVKNGVTAAVSNGYNTTIISCGGAVGRKSRVVNEICDDFMSIDNVIIPNQKNAYSKYLPTILNEFDVSNVLVYDKDSKTQKLLEEYDGQKRNTFGDNVSFTVNINSNITDTIYTFDGAVVQYVKFDGTSLLFATSNTDIANLPESLRTADYILLSDLPKNCDLLKCDTLIFSGDEEKFVKLKAKAELIANDTIDISSENTTKTEIELVRRIQ